MSIPHSLDQDFFKTWTPEMAYVLGYFAADGSMLRNKRGGHFIEFTTTDRCVLITIKRVCDASQQLSIRPQRDEKWKEQYRLQIGSKEWFADLSSLGFTQAKSHTLNFPEVPEEVLGHFVRGYFDGDGCIYFFRQRRKNLNRHIFCYRQGRKKNKIPNFRLATDWLQIYCHG